MQITHLDVVDIKEDEFAVFIQGGCFVALSHERVAHCVDLRSRVKDVECGGMRGVEQAHGLKVCNVFHAFATRDSWKKKGTVNNVS